MNRAWTWNFDDEQKLLADFFHCKREAAFLFDKKLADYLGSLYEGVERYFDANNKLLIKSNNVGFEMKAALEDKFYSASHWLG